MRLLRWLIGSYVVVALLNRVAEAAGARTCHCGPDCWCKKPPLSAFRWVFPYGHRAMDSPEKERTAEP